MVTVPAPTGFLQKLRDIAGPGGWVDPDEDSPYLADPRDRARGRAALVLRPDNVAAVASILKLCSAAQVGVIPYAGGTGLVGGQLTTTPPDPVVLSVDRMTKIRALEPANRAITVEAGCTLAGIRRVAAENGFQFPLRIASENDCRIGGNLATNAGGAQVLRFGNARDLCLGLEAVLADGQIWNGLGTLQKDNSGYDLRNLLIGSEGTLGIITAATLRLFSLPQEEASAFVAIATPTDAARLSAHLQNWLGEVLDIAELIDHTGVEFVREHFPAVDTPLQEDHPWYVFAEAQGGQGSRAAERLEEALASALEQGLVRDAVVAGNIAQRDAMRSLRETIPLANRRVGAVATHDVSVPLARIDELVTAVESIVAGIDERLRTNIFGHLGDGNLHANVFPPAGHSRDQFTSLSAAITGSVFEAVRNLGGSVSAEHGVGRTRRKDAVEQGSPARLYAMHAIKRALDPHGILNPGAVLNFENGDPT